MYLVLKSLLFSNVLSNNIDFKQKSNVTFKYSKKLQKLFLNFIATLYILKDALVLECLDGTLMEPFVNVPTLILYITWCHHQKLVGIPCLYL